MRDMQRDRDRYTCMHTNKQRVLGREEGRLEERIEHIDYCRRFLDGALMHKGTTKSIIIGKQV